MKETRLLHFPFFYCFLVHCFILHCRNARLHSAFFNISSTATATTPVTTPATATATAPAIANMPATANATATAPTNANATEGSLVLANVMLSQIESASRHNEIITQSHRSTFTELMFA